MKICAILPAFNEAEYISGIISKIKSFSVDVIVVDDGSQDETASLAKRQGAFLIQYKTRRGKGSSLKDGFDYARKNNYDIVITMDADGQHDPEEIPLFLKKAEDLSPCIVVGNRMANPTGMPAIRIFTNRLMSAVISAICQQKIPDTQCGYRLFPKDVLSSIDIEARRFEIESELLIKLSKKGYKIESVPIKSIYAGETSRINPIFDTFRFIGFLIKMLRED